MFKALENMSMEMDMPMDDMPDEGLFESCMDLHEDHPDMMECHEMCNTIDDLTQLHGTVEKFGVSKQMLAFANKDGILSSVMPAFAACEALTGDAAADSAEAKAALESTLEKIKEVAGAWFHKAWSVVSGWGEKIAAFAKAGFDKAMMATKWAAGKVFDAAKAAKDVVVAHPIASILALAATAAAVAGVIYTLWSGPLPESEEASASWTSNAKNAISSAFRSKNMGGAEPDPVEPTKSHMDHVKDAASKAAGHVSDAAKTGAGYVQGAALGAAGGLKKGTAAALGYTKDGWDKVVAAVKGLYGEGGALTKLAGFFKSGAASAFEKAKDAGSAGYKYARTALQWLMTQTGHLWSRAPATTMKYFTKALSVFKGLFHKEGLAAPAVHTVDA